MKRDPAGFRRLRLASWPWLLLAFVLLSPALALSSVRMSRSTYRFLFVVDITQSMNVEDMHLPYGVRSRLAFSKALIQAAVTTLPCGSEVGLGVFTAHRTFVMFTPVETCAHYRVISDMLARLDWRMAWAARSEVAKGLYSALDAARAAAHDTRLVFLTDGHEAPPIHESMRPPFRGERGAVTGLIGGVGDALPGRIPVLDDKGVVTGYWRPEDVMQVDVYSLGRPGTQQGEAMAGVNMADVARRIALGQEHLSSLREPYLLELAAQTGLDYLRTESPLAFVEALQDKKYARRTAVVSDIGWIPALLALLCLIYSFVIVPLRRIPPE